MGAFAPKNVIGGMGTHSAESKLDAIKNDLNR